MTSLHQTAPPEIVLMFDEMERPNGLGWEWEVDKRLSTTATFEECQVWGSHYGWEIRNAIDSRSRLLVSGSVLGALQDDGKWAINADVLLHPDLCYGDIATHPDCAPEEVADRYGQTSWGAWWEARIATEAALMRALNRVVHH